MGPWLNIVSSDELCSWRLCGWKAIDMGPLLCAEILLCDPHILNLLLVKIEAWEGPASQVTQTGRKPVALQSLPFQEPGALGSSQGGGRWL